MPDNEDILLEAAVERLQKVRDLWKAIAIASLMLVFFALIPFSIAVWRVVEVRRERVEAVQRQVDVMTQKAISLQIQNAELEKQLEKAKAKVDGK